MKIQEPYFRNYLALVVDDDLVSKTVATRVMSQLGFEVISADDGEIAIELLDEHSPDIILMDVEMDRMNGIDACRLVRQIPSVNNVPIIMMTSHDDSDSIDIAFQAGATDFATKPVNWTLLKHKIKYVMKSQQTLVELYNAESIAGTGNWRQSIDSNDITISNGLNNLLELQNKTQIKMMDYVHPEDRERVVLELARLTDIENVSLNHRMITACNKEIVVHHRAQSLTDFNGQFTAIMGSIQDITETDKTSKRVLQLAYFDELTQLFNRSALVERLTLLTQEPIESRHEFALLHVDIDNFKRINDSLGSVVGDKLLCRFAKRLTNFLEAKGYVLPKQFLAAEDINTLSNLNTLARLSADEFAIILVDNWNEAKIEALGQYLVSEFTHHYQIDDRKLTISASIGIAIYPEHGESAEILSQNADTALHAVKFQGRNNFKVYDATLSRTAEHRMLLELHLRQALNKDELSLHYQPQINISSGEVVGAEALLRWNSTSLGQISPAEFIPLAEDIGLIVPIGNWVLQTACEQLASWHKQGTNLKRMSVNISVRQFSQEDFVSQVSAAVKQSNINPCDMELEITESLLAVDVSEAIRKLEQLKDLGVAISVDDFGTGYSSLSYLKKYPIDRLKIDQSFVRDIDHDMHDVAITKSIISLASGLSLGVIAEGVETEEHLAKLTELGCEEAQGYLIGRPIPHDHFVDWLQDYEKMLVTRKVA